jgi:hypothetical protein
VTAALFGLLAPVAAAWLSLAALRLRTARDSALVTGALSICIGVGLSSLATYWCVLMGVAIGRGFAAVDAIAWTAIGLVAWRALRPRGGATTAATAHAPGHLTWVDWLVRAAFVAVAVTAAATVVAHGMAAPHGEWDAWAIWNQKARFLSRDIEHWTAVLDVTWSNPSHPLLVSLSVARLWAYAGSETTLVPAVLGGVWAVGAAAVVMGALGIGRRRAWIAGAVLIAPATFTQLAAAQTADLAVGLFMVAALAELRSAVLATEEGEARAHLLVSALLCGLTAWTKNEGLVLLVIATPIAGWVAARHGRAGLVAWWLAGVLPVCMTVLWHKTVVAPVPPEYMAEAAGPAAAMARLLDPARHALVWSLIAPRVMTWGGPLAAGALPLTAAAAALAVFTRAGRSGRVVLAVVVLMFAAYYATWLAAPLDTPWLVATTFDRLIVQIWPSLVLVAFSAGDAPAALAVALASPVRPKG